MTPAAEELAFDWCSLPLWLEIATVLLGLVFVLGVRAVHKSWKETSAQPDLDIAERSQGATAVGSFTAAGIAGASILLAGTGVLLAFEPGNSPISPAAFSDLAIGVVWLVVSLISGAFAAAWVVSHVHHSKSVAEHPLVMASSAAQFMGLIFGAFYFVVAFFLF